MQAVKIDPPYEWVKAHDAAGNWKKFDSFGASSEITDNDFIHYLGSRDEDLITESNREIIEAALDEWDTRTNNNVADTWMKNQDSHWAVGFLLGVCIAVKFDVDSEHPAVFLNPVFEELCKLMRQIEEYPVLDEEDWSRRETDAGYENIKTIAYGFTKDDLPDDWEQEVFSWLWDNEQGECESHDDGGCWPSDESVKRALFCLGWLDKDVLEDFVMNQMN